MKDKRKERIKRRNINSLTRKHGKEGGTSLNGKKKGKIEEIEK